MRRRLALPPVSPVNMRAALNYGLVAWFKCLPGHPRGGMRGRYWQNLVGPLDTGPVLDTTSLVSMWRLNESSGSTAADTQGTNNGTYTGTVVLGVDAMSRAATGITLDGDATDYVLCKSGTILAALTNSTIEAWVRSTTTSGERAIYCERAAAGNDIWKMEFSAAGKLQFTHRNDGGSLTQVEVGSGIRDGTWHHVAVTKSGTAVVLYVDGAEAATGTLGGNDAFTDSGLEARIGSDKAAGTVAWIGNVAGVAGYNAALSAATIAAHYIGVRRGAIQWTSGYGKWSGNASPRGFGSIRGNGSNSLRCYNKFGLGLTDYTASCWAYLSGTSLKGLFFHIGRGPTTNDGYGVGVGDPDGDTNGNKALFLLDGVSWNLGTAIGTGWHHFLLTRTGGDFHRLYLDGQQTVVAAGGTAPYNAFFVDGEDDTRLFGGPIDSVRLYTRGLTADQAMRLYQEEKRGNPTTLNWDTRSRMIRAGTPRGGGGKPSGGPGGKNGGKKRILGRRQPGTALMGGM